MYHKETEDKLTDIREYEGLDNLMGDLAWLFQDIRGAHGEMMAASTFDDYTLCDVVNNSGITHGAMLEFEMLLGKSGYNILSLDRDFLGEHGEIIPTVPGGSEPDYGSGKFVTHTFSSAEEFQIHSESNIKEIYENSEAIKILKEIGEFPEIKGISIDKENKLFKFIFVDNSKRIFDFPKLMRGGSPYTETPSSNPKMLSKKNISELLLLEKTQKELVEKLKIDVRTHRSLPHSYDLDFWIEFANYVKYESWSKKDIDEWDIQKQEAFFIVNRNELIKKFFEYKKIDLIDLNIELPKDIKDIKDKLELKVNEIINESISKDYPDLLLEEK